MTVDSKIYKLINEVHLGVISTTNRYGHSESAVVGFAAHDNGHLIFGTDIKSRKYQNILENSRVSIVFWVGAKTVQLEGDARPVPANLIEEYQTVLNNSNTKTKRFNEDPNEGYVYVSLDWYRFSDFSDDPPSVEEYNPDIS